MATHQQRHPHQSRRQVYQARIGPNRPVRGNALGKYLARPGFRDPLHSHSEYPGLWTAFDGHYLNCWNEETARAWVKAAAAYTAQEILTITAEYELRRTIEEIERQRQGDGDGAGRAETADETGTGESA